VKALSPFVTSSRVEARDAPERDPEIRDPTQQSMQIRLVDDWTADLGFAIGGAYLHPIKCPLETRSYLSLDNDPVTQRVHHSTVASGARCVKSKRRITRVIRQRARVLAPPLRRPGEVGMPRWPHIRFRCALRFVLPGVRESPG